ALQHLTADAIAGEVATAIAQPPAAANLSVWIVLNEALRSSCQYEPAEEADENMRASGDALNLVTGLQGADLSALETLMERHAARTYRLALAITRDHADAEEVIQDVFLNVFRKIATFEGRATFGTWIYRITANLALMKRRTN